MITVLASSAGSYPRIGDHPDEQRLRRAYRQLEVGGIAESLYQEIEDAVVVETIAEQVGAGLDIVTDGLIRWSDPISHAARRLSGVTINGLLRYFDNNFYFRQPVVRDRIRRVRPVIPAEFRFATRQASRPVKPVLTGPYTLARASVLATPIYPDLEALVGAYADVVAAEVADLAAAGAQCIQIDEPAILRFPDDLGILAAALRDIYNVRGTSELVLATYFGDAEPFLDTLADLPIDVLALDLVSSPSLASRLATTGARRRLALGMVDARTTAMEDVSTIAPRVEAILAAPLPPGRHYVTTSCGLEFLPRAHARRKLDLVVQLRGAVAGERS